MTPHAWHRVIDEVARDMTAGVPAPGFRARVVQQVSITRPAGRLAAFVSTRRFAGAGAAAALVAIAVVALQPFRSVDPDRSVVRGGAPVATASASADPVEASVTLTAAGSPGSRPARAPQPPAALLEWRARRIAALEGVAPLELDHIQPASLSISQLSVTPLGIAPLVIPEIDDER
jgi:hypothetical protein